jgi:beta-N-acetylhexosaminidase
LGGADVSNLSLDEKIGQLFLVGIPGTRMSPQTRDLLIKIKPAGVLVFSRNIGSAQGIAEYNESLNKLAKKNLKAPLLIAVDQEGDKVARIRSTPPLISPLSVGQTGSISLASDFGKLTAKSLSRLGFNMNLSPVLDLADPEDNSFIGTRSFGLDPGDILKIGREYISSHKSEEVIATAKHFPTHGHEITDSHFAKSRTKMKEEDLLKRDLLPYKALISEGLLDVIMIAHVSFPDLDPEGLPATFSEPIINGLLRKKLGFNGVVLTDDLEMSGASGILDYGERAEKALKAGADLLMFAWNLNAQEFAARHIKDQVKAGNLSESFIDEKVKRILTVKEKYGLFAKTFEANTKKSRLAIRDPELDQLTREVLLHHSTSAVNRMPASEIGNKKVSTVVVSSYSSFFSSYRGGSSRQSLRFIKLSRNTSQRSLEGYYARFPKSRFVYHVTGSASAKLLDNLSEDFLARTVVVNSMTPGDIKVAEKAQHVFNFYSYYPRLGQTIAQLLTPGRIIASENKRRDEQNGKESQ